MIMMKENNIDTFNSLMILAFCKSGLLEDDLETLSTGNWEITKSILKTQHFLKFRPFKQQKSKIILSFIPALSEIAI